MRVFTTILFLALFAVSGCKSKDDHPELRDPIHNDMLKEAAGAKALAEGAVKKIADLEKDLAKTPPRTIERKNIEADLKKQQILQNKYSEFAEYYTIRAEQRKFEGRKRYLKRFEEGKPWPDEEEYKAYMVNKSLMRASRNWNDRVPKAGKTPQMDIPKAELAPTEEQKN